MKTPSATDVLDSIQTSIDASWTSPDDLFGVVRQGDSLWLRAPDAEDVIRITVEKLPRDQWPPMPKG